MLEQSASASDGCGASFALWPARSAPHHSLEIQTAKKDEKLLQSHSVIVPSSAFLARLTAD